MKWSDSGGGDFEQAPVGSHAARCIRVVDIGTQQGEWQGKINYKRKVVIAWELPNALMEETGKPFIVSKFYTASLSEKATLRHDLVSWRGREFTPDELGGFDSKNILGKPCMVSVIHTDKGHAKVQGVMAVPQGMTVPEQVNESLYFSLDSFSRDTFDKLGKGMQGLIEKSPEYGAIMKRQSSPAEHSMASGGGFEDDIPFAPVDWRFA